ncbi:phosphate ABC transporter, permease protein PstA, partial [Pseudomonas sp. CrR25]|nr:phosphate ABC transporter, permease protein PstA [Pseudomonas sp. CrR25]
MKQNNLKTWYKSGAPGVWMSGGAVAIAIIMTIGLLLLIAVRGLGHFWAADVLEAEYRVPGQESRLLIGEVVQKEEVPTARLAGAGLPVDLANSPEFMTRELFKVGNRELFGADFTWLVDEWLTDKRKPQELLTIERREWGNFYGYLLAVKADGQVVAEGNAAWPALEQRLKRSSQLFDELYRVEKKDIGAINHGLERLRLKTRKLELLGQLDTTAQADLDAERAELDARYQVLEKQLIELNQALARDSIVLRVSDGREVELSFSKIVNAYRPNAMSVFDKLGFYFAKLWEFVSDDPREANTEGGIFPAIFGTVLMVMIMAVIVTPFGVVAAVYLREYARQGPLTRVIRIAVNNLAGVPSIVYGVFGLGFFVYVLG